MDLLLNALKSGFSWSGYPTTYEEIVNKDGTTTINVQINGLTASVVLSATTSKTETNISSLIAVALEAANDAKNPGQLPPIGVTNG